MEYKKIIELTTVVTGGTPSTEKREYWDNGSIPWLQSGCCQNCEVNSAGKYITQEGYDNSSTRMMPADTVMIALTGATAGKVGYLNFAACGNQSITGILPCGALNQRYLFYYLISQRHKILADCVGGAQAHISQGYVKNIKVPVLSLVEQEQVVEVLTQLNNIISMRRKEIGLLDTLVKSRFVETFGNPLNGTAKYPIHQVGEVANLVDPQPSHRTPPVEENGVPYVSIKDCDYKTGKIDFEGARKVSPTVLEEHLNRYTLHEGDFVIGKIGTIGNPVFIPARDDYTLSANIVLVQPNRELVSPYFLKYSFESDFVERQFAEAKNSTSQAAFGIQKVRTVKVMNPDLDVQNKFENFVQQVDKSKSKIQKSLEETQLLFDSLMQKYFG